MYANVLTSETNKANFKHLTKETILSMGYTQKDIDNAVFKESYMVMPDTRLFEDFETLITYKIGDGYAPKLYIDSIYIVKNDILIKYSNNSNMRFGYRFNSQKPNKDISTYDEFKFKYNGSNIHKYNKTKVSNYVDAVTNDFIYYMQCFNNANNLIKENQTLFINKGFNFIGETKAYLKTKNFEIEIELYDNGNFSHKLTPIGDANGTKENKINFIDYIINLK